MKQALEKIGLTEGEIKVYLALIELGSSSITSIIKKSGISGSKTYEVLDRLASKGLIAHITKNKVMNPNKETFTNKEAKDYLLSALVAEHGQNKVLNIVDGWKDKFTTKKEAQRFKKSLNGLSGLTLESNLIEELNKKVMKIKDYYR